MSDPVEQEVHVVAVVVQVEQGAWQAAQVDPVA